MGMGKTISTAGMDGRLTPLLLLVALLSGGCARRPMNSALPPQGLPRTEYQFANLQAEGNSTNLIVILAFSGGGTRAAAFAHGVMEGLRDTPIRWEGRDRSLLDEVDLISGVSGGAFCAAYYCVNREKFFTDFERDFLKSDIQGALLAGVLNPFNWWKLGSLHYNRSDLAAEYYSRRLFDHATYGKLAAEGRSPFLMVVATDLTLGTAFSFTQRQFDQINSDLCSVPVGRAVAASSAVPGVLSPVTLRNHVDPARHPMAALNARTGAPIANPYTNHVHHQFIHLVDGGVSDNLAIRPLLRVIEERGEPFSALTPKDAPTKVVFVVVNSQTRVIPDWSRHEWQPGFIFQLIGFSESVMSAYSEDTLELFNSLVAEWTEETQKRRVKIEFYPIEISFKNLPERKDREFFNQVPTSFSLPGPTVDRLKRAGGDLLRASPEYQRLVRDLGGVSAGP